MSAKPAKRRSRKGKVGEKEFRRLVAKARRKRAEFLADGTLPEDCELIAIQLRSRRIPDGLVVIGGYAGIDYLSEKFGETRMIRYTHEADGGTVLIHPDGDYILIVPSPENKRFTFDHRGLLD